jgi:hypothetical protein
MITNAADSRDFRLPGCEILLKDCDLRRFEAEKTGAWRAFAIKTFIGRADHDGIEIWLVHMDQYLRLQQDSLDISE